MKNVFLLFAIAGIAAPYYFIYKFIEANNWEWSTSLFFEQINANPGMKILNADLTVAATTFLIFIIYKRSINALSTKRFLTYIISLFIHNDMYILQNMLYKHFPHSPIVLYNLFHPLIKYKYLYLGFYGDVGQVIFVNLPLESI